MYKKILLKNIIILVETIILKYEILSNMSWISRKKTL